ncbi:hypothetical protein C2845_PM05G13950 [Panicum miliaceum]|uniref:Uncharacterized protein n=1 Tax=Panicum miliaceum TaxID=4540 RepID=A0A3L6SYD7_PANMI|nr:hypothetical protein C2845_PM05G13950 [Panicum miliaceum]
MEGCMCGGEAAFDAWGPDWDYGKLIATFNPADADAIASIKLPNRRLDDVLAWHFDETGTFAVCSAYNLAMQLEHMNLAPSSSSSPGGERKIWANIWKAEIPPKVRIFAWKLSKDDILPTKNNKF